MIILYNRLASEVPAVQKTAGGHNLQAAYDSAAGTALAAKNLLVGDSALIQNKWNYNAEMIDDAFRFGGYSVHTVLEGLALSVVGMAGLVTAGKAVISSLVELATDTPVVLGDGLNFVWLRQDKTVVAVVNSLAVPTGGVPAVYLGMVDRSDPDDTDMSGVLTARGGAALRKTADTNAPADAPPAGTFFWAKTGGGLYTWDGEEYLTFSNVSAEYFFGPMPHTDADPTPHDAWSEPGGVHLTPDDRTDLSGAIEAAADALAASETATTTAAAATVTAEEALALAETAVQDDDPRLTDDRNPTAHAGTHHVTGSDPVLLDPSQVWQLATYIYEKVLAMLQEGDGITLTHDNILQKIMVTAVGAGGGVEPLVVEDDAGSYLVEKLILPGASGTYNALTKAYTLVSISDEE